jgi:hypothetical protein
VVNFHVVVEFDAETRVDVVESQLEFGSPVVEYDRKAIPVRQPLS